MRFFNDLQKYWRYVIRSAGAQLKADVSNSYLDWMWWILEPICSMLVYTVVFGYIFNMKEQYFTVFLFIGITMWSFFSRNLNASIRLIKANKSIVTKIYVPKQMLYLKIMCVNGFKMLVSFGIVAIMLLVCRVPLTLWVFNAIPVFILLFILTYGLGCVLMHFGVYMEDLTYIVSIVLNMMMYFTGIFYSITNRVPSPYGEILAAVNPMAFLVISMRDALLYGKGMPPAVFGVWALLSALIAILGTRLIYKNENSYVKAI